MISRTRALWGAWALFVPLVAIANAAVEAVPHARGIAFVPQLRYALTTPACLLGAVGATFLYRFLQGRTDRPRYRFGTVLLALAAVVLTLTGVMGPPGLGRAAAPAVLGVGMALALLVPRFVERPRRLPGTVAATTLGMLAIVGVLAALASERVAPAGPDGMAFEVPERLFAADHRFVDLPSGARVHYVDVGTGETLLFLHGNPAWSFQWRDLIGGLRGSFRCVALDYPGFGLSSAPPGYGFTPREQSEVLEEFVESLGLHDLTLVMQDWGGPIGLGLAGRRPELVRGVVVGNTWAWPTTVSEARGKFSKIAGGPIGEFVQMNFNGFAWMAQRHDIVRKLPADVADVYLRPFRPLDRRGVAAFYPGQITAASDYFGEVQAGLDRVRDRRALIVWGMRDPGFPRVDLERFEAAFPKHTTIELAGAGHFFFEDAPQQVVEAIRAFASGHPPDARVQQGTYFFSASLARRSRSRRLDSPPLPGREQGGGKAEVRKAENAAGRRPHRQ
jgi:pimeloyl-ACP methyl ester carboxylesterase